MPADLPCFLFVPSQTDFPRLGIDGNVNRVYLHRMATDLLTAAETCERLGIGGTQLGRIIESGRLEVAVKLPGIRGPRLFRVADVDRLAAERVAS